MTIDHRTDHSAIDAVHMQVGPDVKHNEPNPYESPRSLVRDGPITALSSIIRGILRLLILAAVGYVSFTAFGLLYWALSDPNVGQATITWALSVGLLGAIAFPSSEIFNAGPGASAGVVRRVLVALGVLFASLMIAGMICDLPSWRHRSYFADPWEVPKTVLSVIVVVVAFVAARVIWISNHPSRDA